MAKAKLTQDGTAFTFPINKGTRGHIRVDDSPLDGAEAEMVSGINTGFAVKLLQNRGAYKVGDIVHVGGGEFRP